MTVNMRNMDNDLIVKWQQFKISLKLLFVNSNDNQEQQ